MKNLYLFTGLCLALSLALMGCDGDPEPVDSGTPPTDTGPVADTGPGGEDSGTPTGFDFRTDDPAAYTRVDRSGMPGVSTALIMSKNEYNDSSPAGDVPIAENVFVPEIIATLGLAPHPEGQGGDAVVGCGRTRRIEVVRA